MDDIRRRLMGAALVAALAPLAQAQDAGGSVRKGGRWDEPPDETIDLWPNTPPDPSPNDATGGERTSNKGTVSHVMRPRLNIYRPARPNRGAVLVIAGGGYDHIELGNESTPTCQWLKSLGVTAFELVYRLPEQGWSRLAPLQDGQRAMRLIRARARNERYEAGRIAVLGFSAGGHLAGMTAVTPDVVRYAPVDEVDRESARPDLAGLIYPVLTLMPPFNHTRTRLHIVGEHPTEAESAELSVNLQVNSNTPRAFLAQALDDPVSPIDNSLLMLNAMRTARVPAELHVFQTGGHGWGLGAANSEVRAWPALLETWLRLNQFWT
ncbi:alpha/beta hydrolase [Burkholderia metallica]|uniref:alpha/beta hydrolase n=1 Tax=Burkholderia metallica TaxID=488729 RepID=UPI001CF43775|nr:alpha/beta hydrolase [Burkholderia metallica]MCA8023418.1 alpha/beta hydrolase [Burkholderia metallica]